MATDIDRLEKEIHSLSMKEKAYLVRSLIDDLDNMDDKASEKLWVEEVERRYEAYQEGKIKVVPGDEAMRRAHLRIK